LFSPASAFGDGPLDAANGHLAARLLRAYRCCSGLTTGFALSAVIDWPMISTAALRQTKAIARSDRF
jgi:hypothetical protein